ncbi:MAG: hypothetical protein M1383_00675 [Patescibacteria group bacterium]|nr:hypothetical protein [Patescibacteria group bacterium]
MAQINLLKQKTASSNLAEALTAWVVRILAVAVFALAGYYGWLFFQLKQANKEILQLQQDIASKQSSFGEIKEQSEVYTRQGQLKELSALIDGHFYWSNFLPVLANSTLKQASYSSLKATPDGEISLSASVPDLLYLDKYLRVFDQPEFYKYFYDFKIGSYHRISSSDGAESVNFDVKFKFDPNLIKYASPASATAGGNNN